MEQRVAANLHPNPTHDARQVQVCKQHNRSMKLKQTL